MKISYAVTVCNEFIEIQRLLNLLIKNIKKGDEIVVQHDEENTTLEVLKVLNKYVDHIKVIKFPLNGHFANFKNNLTEACSGDYIFQIDADEIISEYCIENLGMVLQYNDVDVLRVPRINTVEGLTQEHIQKWGWRIDEKGWINFPDLQWRVYKNNGKIKWKNKVHEVLEGHKSVSYLPLEEPWCLKHPKSIEKQEKQNNLYNTL